MKKIILFLSFLVMQVCSFGQSPFTGIWEGKIHAGVEVRLIFTISQGQSRKFAAAMDVPDQGIKGIVCSDVIVRNDSLFIKIKEFDGSYAGRQANDTLINGEWKQGISTALHLRKVKTVQLIQRSQTPVPPFAYKTEDIIYANKDKTIQYGASITIPNGNGPFPAVILITGSGQQNRDEEISGHKPFAVIADHLTRNGFVVLRVDDRGVGQTTGDVMTATTLDFCNDVSAGIEYLKSRKEVDKKRLALVGHSEGGMIAGVLASTRSDIAAIVLLAAPGRSGSDVLIEQNKAYFANAGMPAEYIDAYIELYTSLIENPKNKADKDAVRSEVALKVESWIKRTPGNIVRATTGITNDAKKTEFINSFSAFLGSPWFQYFLNFEPRQYLEKVNCKVLAINGSKDIQVLPQSNLEAIEAALKKSNTTGYRIKEYEGLNHLFQKCNTCAVSEYGVLEETISIEVLKDITSWLASEM